MGIGDWGLGIGDWGLGIGPNPQSPLLILYNLIKNINNINIKHFILNNYIIY